MDDANRLIRKKAAVYIVGVFIAGLFYEKIKVAVNHDLAFVALMVGYFFALRLVAEWVDKE